MNSIAIMGTITQDIIHEKDKSISSIGGIPWFAVELQRDIKFPIKLVTNIGADFNTTNIPHPILKRSIINKLHFKTPIVEINTKNNNANAKVIGFKNSHIKDSVQSDICIISSLFNEISLNTIEKVRKQTKTLIIDIQGFTRPKSTGDTILANSLKKQPDNLQKICNLADILKCTEQELTILLPNLKKNEKIHKLHKWGLKTLLITQGEKGCWISTTEEEVQIFKTIPVKLKNSTGAGDKFLILLANSLLEHLSIQDAIIETQKRLGKILLKGN